MTTALLSEVAEINPPGPRNGQISLETMVDFVPMAAVSEDGTMIVSESRPYGAVAKGFTAFRDNDLLLAKITPCYENNKIAIATVSTDYAFGSTEFHTIRCHKDRLDPRYLMYFLRQDSVRHAGEKRMTGSAGQKRVPRTFLEELVIPLPSLEQQRRIAAILDQADTLRRLRQRSSERLNELGQSLFLEMFGDPLTNPKGWDRVKLDDICRRITVGIVVKPASYYKKIGVPAIRGTNITEMGIDLSDAVYFSKEDNETTLVKTRIWKGDVIIVRSGRPGLAAVVPTELDGINCIDVLIATPDKTHLLPFFLRDFINSDGGKRIVSRQSRGQVQQHFNVGSLSQAEVFLPPLKCQEEYEKRIAHIELQRRMTFSALAKSDNLFSTLQQRGYRGNLRL
jgi:type I restriction enzyme, S subunit